MCACDFASRFGESTRRHSAWVGIAIETPGPKRSVLFVFVWISSYPCRFFPPCALPWIGSAYEPATLGSTFGSSANTESALNVMHKIMNDTRCLGHGMEESAFTHPRSSSGIPPKADSGWDGCLIPGRHEVDAASLSNNWLRIEQSAM